MHFFQRGKNREKLKNLQTFDLSYFIGKSYQDDNGSQTYLILQPIFESFEILLFLWKSKGLLEERITTHATSDNRFAQKLTCIYNSEIAVKFEIISLKQDKVSFSHRNLVNFFVVYKLNI